MPRSFFALLFCLCALASAGVAQDRFELGSDVYAGGQTVTLTEPERDDVFLSGLRVRIDAAISGNAYLAGRFVDINAAVGASLYAVAQGISVSAPVAQDAILTGQRVTIDAPVAGDLRIAASEAEINASVGDTLVVFAEFAALNAAVAGDVALSALDLSFGPQARIDGRLILYEDGETPVVIPERVIAEDRIERRDFDGRLLWQDAVDRPKPAKPKNKGKKAKGPEWPMGYIWSFVAVAVVTAGVALLARNVMDDIRRQALERGLAAFGWGFGAWAATLGASLLFAMSVVGLVLVPLIALALVPMLIWGLVNGAYALGSRVMALWGALPDWPLARISAALIGVTLAGVLGYLPFLGNLVLAALAIWGLGATVLHLLSPRLFAD
jgi:hypothetical protein